MVDMSFTWKITYELWAFLESLSGQPSPPSYRACLALEHGPFGRKSHQAGGKAWSCRSALVYFPHAINNSFCLLLPAGRWLLMIELGGWVLRACDWLEYWGGGEEKSELAQTENCKG